MEDKNCDFSLILGEMDGIPQQDSPLDNDDQVIAAAESSPIESSPHPKTYTVRGLVDIARLKIEPVEYIWNDMPLLKGGLIEVIGAPGVGKSRFLASLAKAQILGRRFGGLDTLSAPKKWLFVGSENGINRIQREAQKFLIGEFKGDISSWTDKAFMEAARTNGFTDEEVERVNTHFRTFTLEDPADCLISLCPENCEKLKATLLEWKPDILVCDPWGDLIDGDELVDRDVRQTIAALRFCLAEAKLAIPSIIVNHARMGIKEVAHASGFDAGNFGKNSKCLYSIARYVLNIRPAAQGNNPPIEVICAKNNDGPVPPPVALKLNEATEMYEALEGFDHSAWQKELEGLSRQAVKASAASHMTRDERDGFVRQVYKELILKHGEYPYGETELRNDIRATFTGLSVRQAQAILLALKGSARDCEHLIKELGVAYYERPFPRGKFIGTPEQIEAIKTKASSQEKGGKKKKKASSKRKKKTV